MGDKGPILEYGRPDDRSRRTPLPLHILFGIFAAVTTLIAAICLLGGLLDIVERIPNGVPAFLAGLVFVAIAFFLWKPVGLTLWARHRPKDGDDTANG
jgi:hypothetical protein